jgi:hypothetical protein
MARRRQVLSAAIAGGFVFCADAALARRPAPPHSRYGYLLRFDPLPEGMTTHVWGIGEGRSYSIANASDVPLVVNVRLDGRGGLEWGEMLVAGRVQHYFRDGVPQQGRQHEKGWVQTALTTARLFVKEAKDVIDEGRAAGLSRKLPPPRPFAVSAVYDDKPFSITGTVRFELNPEYGKAR